MNKQSKKNFIIAGALFLVFVVWTILVSLVNVEMIGPDNSSVGFSNLNKAFFESTGGAINQTLYGLTEIVGVLPILCAVAFVGVGVYQAIKRKSIKKVDGDICALGWLYVLVVIFYELFEVVVVNYRPVLIEGVLEASYPSSHTLLACTILGTTILQIINRVNVKGLKILLICLCVIVCAVIVVGRLLSGVHWLTDIVGGVLLSGALIYLYYGAISLAKEKGIIQSN